MPDARVVIVDCNYEPDNPHAVFVEMRSLLARDGIGLVVDNCWSDDYPGFDLIIGADPLRDHTSISDARILGQRTLNRRTRLDVAERCGAGVAPFGGPRSDEELDALAGQWGTDLVVLKYDWSARRNGVFLWSLAEADRKPFPEDFDPESDVFMAFLDADPVTYKVDAFGGVVLGAHTLATQDMRIVNWQQIRDIESRAFELPGEVACDISAVSRALLNDGAGYCSFDLMRSDQGFKIIEMNTCGVGTGPWTIWPEQYAERYAEGIRSALDDIQSIPVYGRLRDRAVRLGNDEQAPNLPVRTNDESSRGEADSSTGPVVTERRFLTILGQSEMADMSVQVQYIFGPLQDLILHAAKNVPCYAQSLRPIISAAGELDLRRWHEVPVINRDEVADKRLALLARKVPPNHGSVWFANTAGTQGDALTISKTRLAIGANTCIECRTGDWHGLATSDPIALILQPSVVVRPDNTKWAPEWAGDERGNRYEHSSLASALDHLAWLQTLGPVWLKTRPSLAQLMAFAIVDDPDLKPQLRGLMTSGETLTDDQRRLFRAQFGVDPINVYQNAEAGIIAVQCPRTDALHVQQEVVYVELLNERNIPCAPGETGRVVVTTLYNMAMPLVRYDTGDIAVAEDDFRTISDTICVCGRRLPRLRTVLGRARNRLVLPHAGDIQPDLDSSVIRDSSGAVLWQLRQDNPHEFSLVLDAASCRDSYSRDALAAAVSGRIGGNTTLQVEKADLAAQAKTGRHDVYLNTARD